LARQAEIKALMRIMTGEKYVGRPPHKLKKAENK